MNEAGATESSKSEALARGYLLERDDESIVLGTTGTEYRVHLIPTAPMQVDIGKRIVGRVVANARRIDVVTTGGRFIEPLFGRPRRVQGRVLEIDAAHNRVIVAAAVPVTLVVGPGQQAQQFQEGQLVSCDVAPGAKFEPV